MRVSTTTSFQILFLEMIYSLLSFAHKFEANTTSFQIFFLETIYSLLSFARKFDASLSASKQGWQGRWGARGAGRQKAALPAGARGAAKCRGPGR